MRNCYREYCCRGTSQHLSPKIALYFFNPSFDFLWGVQAAAKMYFPFTPPLPLLFCHLLIKDDCNSGYFREPLFFTFVFLYSSTSGFENFIFYIFSFPFLPISSHASHPFWYIQLLSCAVLYFLLCLHRLFALLFKGYTWSTLKHTLLQVKCFQRLTINMWYL